MSTKPTYKNIGDKIVAHIESEVNIINEQINAIEELAPIDITRDQNHRLTMLRLERDTLMGVQVASIRVIIAETGKYDA